MASRPYRPGKIFTGVPCPKGHIAERLVYNMQCVVCKREGDRVSNIKATRKYNLAKHYNLTESDVELMREQQINQCAICYTSLTPRHGTQIDHCHATGKVRGLLCNHCNRLLGCAKDDVNILQNAINYLQTPGGKKQ